MIRVVRGNPTREELAAAVAVVQARTAAATDTPPEPPTAPAAWSSPARITRRPLARPGPNAWARTYWPG